jgi:hypothetical protein
MRDRKKVASLLMLGALLLVAGIAMVPPAQASTCYGVLYEYYATSAMQEIVGAKVSCPGYPDQIDCEGSHTETAFFTTETVVCPCPSGGGGGTGGGETTEDDPPE